TRKAIADHQPRIRGGQPPGRIFPATCSGFAAAGRPHRRHRTHRTHRAVPPPSPTPTPSLDGLTDLAADVGRTDVLGRPSGTAAVTDLSGRADLTGRAAVTDLSGRTVSRRRGHRQHSRLSTAASLGACTAAGVGLERSVLIGQITQGDVQSLGRLAALNDNVRLLAWILLTQGRE
ncbi:hypothetical protein, partial [Paenarthrobacter sp. Z7-10]|uniref:hypothetical protein n=1 Tax=Paenarthrobacter sp. Z7-10 TaxID=2787635 RepID=UPI0022A8E152